MPSMTFIDGQTIIPAVWCNEQDTNTFVTTPANTSAIAAETLARVAADALLAPLASPTFTGTVGGITAAMVGAPSGSGTSTGNNTGDQVNITGNAGTVTNGVYTTDANTVFLTPTGSAAALTSFPTLNQNTTGTAATATNALSLGGNLASTYAPLVSPTFTDRVNTPSINSGQIGGFRNKIINGDMQVSQVNGGTAVTPTTVTSYPLDQWESITSQTSKLTYAQVADAPAGFKYSTKITVASQYAPIATDFFGYVQPIEGLNIIDFQLGTAGAATLSSSNYIKGSVAGVYSVYIKNGTYNRSYVGTINVTTAWTKVVITLVGDTAGTWTINNTVGLQWGIDLGSGTNWATTANTWQTGNFQRTSNSVTFVNQVAGSTLNITGVQLEKVSAGATQGTEFEHVSYADQLRWCQYYYEQALVTDAGGLGNTQTLPAYGASAMPGFKFKATKRATPTVTIYSRNGTANKVSSSVSGADVGASVSPGTVSLTGVNALIDSGSGFTVGTVGYEAFYTADARM